MRVRKAGFALAGLAMTSLTMSWGADPASSPAPTGRTDLAAQVESLKKILADQQGQIEALKAVLEDQKKFLERIGADSVSTSANRIVPSDRLIASTSPMIPAASAPAVPPKPFPQGGGASTSSPLQLQIGDTTITPIGFMDLTMTWKDKDAGGSLGSNFGSIPFNNSPASKLSEFRFSPQNSRLGFRVDGNWKGAHFIAYNEFDFLGTSGGNNLSVTNGAFVPRIRLYWVDVRKGKWEVLAGQSWSMLTPNRKGISALPSDLFYSQVIDVNYMAGLTWTRQAGVRMVYHPSSKVTMGLSLENPDQYIGGSAGGSPIVLPAAFTGLAGTQLDNQTNVQTIPDLHPDIIAKVAFDPSPRAHVEFSGIARTFKIWNTSTGQPTSGQYSTKTGGGLSVNANFEVVKNLRLVTNNYWSDGGGRYLFGQAPDVVVRADGTVSPIHSGGVLDGLEATVTKNLLLYAYYGGIYIQRNVVVDAKNALVGYGFTGSPNNQNRAIQEVSFGFTQTFWKDAKYGALSLMGQYEYLTRAPWFVAINAPKATHDNTIYINLRYTLPGSAPPVK
ncbi:MAG: hypothetical protein ABI693_15485 [Bryobacteraceae bacterium]